MTGGYHTVVDVATHTTHATHATHTTHAAHIAHSTDGTHITTHIGDIRQPTAEPAADTVASTRQEVTGAAAGGDASARPR